MHPVVIPLYEPLEEGSSAVGECLPTPIRARPLALTNWILALSVLGVACSIYLFLLHYSTKPSICEINSVLSCEKVDKSPYSTLLGVPLSVYGAIWFGILSMMAMHFRKTAAVTSAFWMLAWSLSGLGAVGYLVGVELAIGAICPICTLVHVIILIEVTLSSLVVRSARTGGLLSSFRQHLQVNVKLCLVVALLFALPVLVFNLPASKQPPPPSGPDADAEAKMALALCLERTGVEMFGANWCVHCIDQKELFGHPAADHIRFWDCANSTNSQRCRAYKVDAYPTWIAFDSLGKARDRHVGEMPLVGLAKWAHCPYPGA